MKQKLLPELTKGFLKENPVLRLVLGTCPTLAISTSVSAALGMSAAATIVLLFSNIAISALRKVIPDKVRIPAYITIIAGLVTIVQMLVKAYVPATDKALGIYLPLITTNCAVLGVTLLHFTHGYTYFEALINAFAAGVGFLLAMVMFAGVRNKLEGNNIPKSLQGLPITLIAAGLMSLSFMGLTGLAEGIFNR